MWYLSMNYSRYMHIKHSKASQQATTTTGGHEEENKKSSSSQTVSGVNECIKCLCRNKLNAAKRDQGCEATPSAGAIKISGIKANIMLDKSTVCIH